MKLLIALLVLLGLPLLDSGYLTNMFIVVMLHALPAIGVSILMGYTGQISLGHAAFYGLGAYVSAAFSVYYGINPWVSIIVAAIIVSAVASYLGWIIFRLRGHYLAVATLGFGFIVSVAFVELRDWTGGPNGLSGIPPLSLFGYEFITDASFYFVAWAAMMLTVWTAHNLVNSPTGLVMRGIAESERAVASLGNDVTGIKRKVLVLSVAYAAVSGGLYAHYIGYISPQPFGIDFSIKLVVIIAIGGFRSIGGVLFATMFVTVITEPLQELGYYDVVTYGLFLVIIITYMPQGLLQAMYGFARSLIASFKFSLKSNSYGSSPNDREI